MNYEVNSEVGDGVIESFDNRDDAIAFAKKLKFRGETFDSFEIEETDDEITVYGEFTSPSMKSWNRTVAVISKIEE